ncbi:MAG: ATP-binding cassette domain-containing protein, partial [Halieaceae bacterium]|nr:ATP-binding cassette domain-containing protein [Halieaceae bacterium]
MPTDKSRVGEPIHCCPTRSAFIKINQGEAIGLIGTSGGGKTTLFDILLGLLEPQKGSLF